MLVNLKQLFRDNPSALNRVLLYESRIEEANQRLENAVNKILINKIELGRDVNSDVSVLQIVDRGKLKIKEISTPEFELHDHDHSDPNHRH